MAASEVTVKDKAPSVRQLPSLPRDVLMANGLTLWGPPNVAQTVVDYDDFIQQYRGFHIDMELPLQIRQAFIGGVRKAIINRIVHVNPTTGVPVTAAKAESTRQTAAGAPTNGSVLGTNIEPFALASGDDLIGSVDGAINQTVPFTATSATLECGTAENYALVNGEGIDVIIDGAGSQAITFLTGEFVNIGAATAEEVAAVINAKIIGASATPTSGGTKVTITSDNAGTNSSVEVTGGASNIALGFSTVAVNGGGNVGIIASVTVAEIKLLVEAAWTNGGGVTVTNVGGAVQIEANTPGSTGSVLVVTSSTSDDELGFDNVTHSGTDGTPQNTLKVSGLYVGGTIGNAITYDITDASSEVAEEFNLLVYLNGNLLEPFENVDMDTIEDIVNTLAGRSTLVSVEDQAAGGTLLQRRPANGLAIALSGGDDGLDSLDNADFIGSEALTTGLFAFELKDEGDMLICPDSPTAEVANAAIQYCINQRKLSCTFIPDVPIGEDRAGAVSYAQSISNGGEDIANKPAWPNIKIPNPDKAIYGPEDTITILTSGSIAGRCARNTLVIKQDVFTQPGNEIYGRLENVVGVEDEEVKKISVRRFLSTDINPILFGKTTTGAFGVWLNDVQANAGKGNFTSIGEIRGMAHIRKTISQYLETIRTTPNTPQNRLRDKDIIEAYLGQWLAREVFASKRAEEAFSVNTDPQGKGINNPIEQAAERYTISVAVATAKSRRLIGVNFTRDSRAVENYIQQQLNAP